MASAESVNTSEDVKAENPTVPGFVLIENFITEEEEVELLEEINKGHWVSNRTKDRRVQVFGPYHDTNYKIIPGKFSEHPEWAQKLAKRIQKLNIDSNSRKLTDPKRCEGYTNEYSDGVELYYHTDHRSTPRRAGPLFCNTWQNNICVIFFTAPILQDITRDPRTNCFAHPAG